MKADLFYETKRENALPLHLISEAEWKEAIEPLSPQERHVFIAQDFKGKLGDSCLIHHANGEIAKVYIGSGEGNQEQALGEAARILPEGSYQAEVILSQTAALYWALAQYRFDVYKKIDCKPRRLVVKPTDLKALLDMAESIFLVRDLINTPANHMGPQELSEALEKLAKTHRAQFQQWVGEELLMHNFPAIEAVGRASINAPRLLSLTYGNKSHPRVTLVGKGVCFDTGGLNLKDATGMRIMKKDMGGAAHVIGLADWIMRRGLPIRLQVLIPAVENSVGSNAFRPGDILKMRNQLTVEVDNTDAEGRLILADALTKASEGQPELIIDYATLTGSARSALGTEVGALFCNDDKVAEEILDASLAAKDPLWRLPLYAGYEDQLSSSIADLVNCGPDPFGGAIIAALFLQRFVAKPIKWVHFDIMAWNWRSKPGRPEGGEALGLRAVALYLSRVYGD